MTENMRCYRPLIIGRRGAVGGESSAGGAGRADGVARRRQRGRRGGRDGARAGRGRADDVRARRRRRSIMSSTARPARPWCSTAPARRRAPRRRSVMPAASRAPGRCRCRCRACSPGSALMHRGSAACRGREPFRRGDPARARRVWRDAALPAFRRRTSRRLCAPTSAAPRSSCRRRRRRRSARRSSSPSSPAPSKRSPPRGRNASIAARSPAGSPRRWPNAGTLVARSRPRRVRGRGAGADRDRLSRLHACSRRRPTRPASCCCRS